MKKYLSILGLSLMGCASTMSNDHPIPPSAQGPALVQVVSRDTTIVARSSPVGPVYSLQSNTGQVIVPSMTLPEIQARHPELARHIQTMNASSRDTGAWAGVE